ncbi:MAG: extracellular solute-binding protein [Lachnospiraceae bacterium]
MKKTIKRVAALGLAVTSVMGLVACGNKADDNKTTEATTAKATVDWSKVEKPKSIKVMVDKTVLEEGNGGEEFYADLAKCIGMDEKAINWVRPPHSEYYTQVSQAFLSASTTPDVVLLSSDYLSQYAANGMLWDMTDAWAASETKNSGRLISAAEQVLAANVVAGLDGEKRMYGFSPYRGNGCCTFVSVEWLEAAGYKKSDIEGKTLTFDQYYEMLEKMKASGKVGENGVISAPGLISSEAPYTNYLPEFYQKANYTFYLDGDKYVDGFTQPEMKAALERLQKAYQDGILDKNCITEKDTKSYREKFFQGKNGAYTYWAGNWANTTVTNMKKYLGEGHNEIVYLEPIAELGKYVERLAPAWCITTECDEPESVFKYFIDTMLDGGRTQIAWTYGPEGTSWSIEAEDYSVDDGKTTKTAKAGEFHFLQQKSTIGSGKGSAYSKNHIDPFISLATFKEDFVLDNSIAGDGTVKCTKKGNPGSITEIATKNGEWFTGVSAVATPLPTTEELSTYIGEINKQRDEAIAKIVVDGKSVDEMMTAYTKAVGENIQEVIDSLNATIKKKAN